MADRSDIVLRQEQPAGPPGILDQLKRSVEELFSPAVDGAANYVRGKGEAEVAKAAEIRAKVYTDIAQLDHEREKLINERDVAIRASVNEQERDRMAHAEKMYALKTERLLHVVESLKKLRDMEVGVELKVMKKVATILVETIED